MAADNKAAVKEKNTAENTLAVYDMQGNEVGAVDYILGGDTKPRLVAQVVNMYRANKRSGLAATKTRGEVSGGGKKPWKQKGTGRARVGSSRNPLWRHGGVVFGPHPKNYSYSLSARQRNLALFSALNEKKSNGRIFVLDKLEINEGKSKYVKGFTLRLKLKGKVLIIANNFENKFLRAARNISNLKTVLDRDVNALDVLNSNGVVVLRDSLAHLKARQDKIKNN